MTPKKSSDIQVEYAINYAISVFGSKRKAMRWLSLPYIYLNGQSPMSALQNEESYQEVLDILGRIEHGIFA